LQEFVESLFHKHRAEEAKAHWHNFNFSGALAGIRTPNQQIMRRFAGINEAGPSKMKQLGNAHTPQQVGEARIAANWIPNRLVFYKDSDRPSC
jgi:hypothetical protein